MSQIPLPLIISTRRATIYSYNMTHHLSSHYLNQFWLIVNRLLGEQISVKLVSNYNISMQQNEFEDVCKMAAIYKNWQVALNGNTLCDMTCVIPIKLLIMQEKWNVEFYPTHTKPTIQSSLFTKCFSMQQEINTHDKYSGYLLHKFVIVSPSNTN